MDQNKLEEEEEDKSKCDSDLKTKKSPNKSRVNYSDAAVDLNSIAKVTSSVASSIPASKNLESLNNEKNNLTKNRDRLSSYGELKSILKRSVRNISNRNKEHSIDTSRQHLNQHSTKLTNYRHEMSDGCQTSPGTLKKKNSNLYQQKNEKNSNDKELNEILTNNNHLYKFYITRLKHSLIISFLILMSIQNILLFIVSILSEQVFTKFIHI
jgi:hypothetical protein